MTMITFPEDCTNPEQQISYIIANILWDRYAADIMAFSNDRTVRNSTIFIPHVGAFFEVLGEDVLRVRDGVTYTELDTALFMIENPAIVRNSLTIITDDYGVKPWINIDHSNKCMSIKMTKSH